MTGTALDPMLPVISFVNDRRAVVKIDKTCCSALTARAVERRHTGKACMVRSGTFNSHLFITTRNSYGTDGIHLGRPERPVLTLP